MAKSNSPRISKQTNAEVASRKKAAEKPVAIPPAEGPGSRSGQQGRARSKSSQPATQAKGSRDHVTEEQIRRRAHEIYLTRNGGAGDPVSDWLQAERELRGNA